jgi:dihydrofolate reductase
MRKVVSLMHVSLDGFVADPDGGLYWAIVDGEIQTYVENLLRTVDMALYGRTTYHMMEGYWPTVPANPESTKHEIDHAHWVENVSKVVFSRTLSEVTWNNTKLVKGNILEEVSRRKNEPGGDMMIFGSPGITQTFMQLGLIDEYRWNINPVILGSGIPLFKGGTEKLPLKLIEAKTFQSGVLGLCYQPDKK